MSGHSLFKESPPLKIDHAETNAEIFFAMIVLANALSDVVFSVSILGGEILCN